MILVKLFQLNLKKNKLKFSVTVTLKKDVLDPQGKVVENTLISMGMENLKSIRQGKFFEIEIDEQDQKKAEIKVDDMCKKLLVNLIIEDYKINNKSCNRSGENNGKRWTEPLNNGHHMSFADCFQFYNSKILEFIESKI